MKKIKDKKNIINSKSGFTPTPNLVSGFTLIELMVATTIFIVVMVASMGSLFTLLDASKGSKALRSAMDNVNFAMDSMTRSIRMGTNYYCGDSNSNIMVSTETKHDCPVGETGFSFVPQNDGGASDYRIGYILSKYNDSDNYTLKKCYSTSSNCVSIISPEVNIKKLKFFVKGAEEDQKQASVYIIMKGTVVIKGVETSFAIQTLASQRNF